MESDSKIQLRKKEIIMKEDITPLIRSKPMIVIGGRLLVKESVYSDGNHPESTMFVIRDLVENHFKIQFFNSREKAAGLLNLLKTAVQ